MDEEEEDAACPLCLEELDIADRNFFPCSCSYQICRFCWNRILSNLNGRCPACRQPYDRENITFKPLDPEQIAKEQNEKKLRDKLKKQQEANSRKNLTNVRVIQRNLVYITNLPVSIAKEELLKNFPYFGQYGKILKVVVNKSRAYNVGHPNGPSYSAYITFDRQQDALVAIQCVDGFWIEGRSIRAAFGTTKYCSYFLRDMVCTNAECMYLHQLGGEADSFTKEDMTAGKHHFHDQIHPASQLPPSALRTPVEGARTVLPPPSSVVGLRTSTDPMAMTDSIEVPMMDKATPERTSLSSSLGPPPALTASGPTAASGRTKKGRGTTTVPPPDADPTRSILPPTASWAGARNRGETPQRKEELSPERTLESPNETSGNEAKSPRIEADIPKANVSFESVSREVIPPHPHRLKDDLGVEDLGFDPWVEGATGLHDFIESPPRITTPDTIENITTPQPTNTHSSSSSSSSSFTFHSDILLTKDATDHRDFQDVPPGFLGATFHSTHAQHTVQAAAPRKAAKSRFGFAQEEEAASNTSFPQSASVPVSFESSSSLPYQPDHNWSLDSPASLFASHAPPFGMHQEDYRTGGWVTSPSQIAPSPFGTWMIPGALGLPETPPFLSAPSWQADISNSLYPSSFQGGFLDSKGMLDDKGGRPSMPIHISLSDDFLSPVSPRTEPPSLPSSASSAGAKEETSVRSMPFFDSAIISAGPFSRSIPHPAPSSVAPSPPPFSSSEGLGKRDDADLKSLVGIPDRPTRLEVEEEAAKSQAQFPKNPLPKQRQAEYGPPSWHGQYPYPNPIDPNAFPNFTHSYHHHGGPHHHPHHLPQDQQALSSSLYGRNYPQQGRFHHRDQRKEFDDHRRNRSLSGNGVQTSAAFAPNRPPYPANPPPFRQKHTYNKGYEQTRHIPQPIHTSAHHSYAHAPPQPPALPQHLHHHHSPVLQSTNVTQHSPQLLSSQPIAYPSAAPLHSAHAPQPHPPQTAALSIAADAHEKLEDKKTKAKKAPRAALPKGKAESDTQRGSKSFVTMSYDVLQTEDDDVWESHDPTRVELGSKSSWADDSESDEEEEEVEKEKAKEVIEAKAQAQTKEAKGKLSKSTPVPSEQAAPASKGDRLVASSTSSAASQALASSSSAPSRPSQPPAVKAQPQKNTQPTQGKKAQQTKQKKASPSPSPSPTPSPTPSPYPSSASQASGKLSSSSTLPSTTQSTSSVGPPSRENTVSISSQSSSSSSASLTQTHHADTNTVKDLPSLPSVDRVAYSRPSLRQLSPAEIDELTQEMKAFLESMVSIPKPLLLPSSSAPPSFSLAASYLPPDEENLSVDIPLDSILELSERYSEYEIKCLEEQYNMQAEETQDLAVRLHEVAVEMKKLI